MRSCKRTTADMTSTKNDNSTLTAGSIACASDNSQQHNFTHSIARDHSRQHNGHIHGGYNHTEINYNYYGQTLQRRFAPPQIRRKHLALMNAAWKGQTLRVRKLIQEGVDPNCPGYNADWLGSTALHYACREGHAETAEMLITDYGSDVNALNWIDCTPLYYAAHSGNIEVVELLLRHRVYLNGKGPSALNVACSRGHPHIVKRLVEAGIPISMSRLHPVGFVKEGMSFLPAAINATSCRNRPLSIQLLDAQPIHVAICSDHLDIAAYLLENGALPQSTTTVAWAEQNESTTPILRFTGLSEANITPLMLARGPLCASLLLDHGVDINQQSSEGRTAAMLAAALDDARVLELLGERGADWSIADKRGRTALTYAQMRTRSREEQEFESYMEEDMLSARLRKRDYQKRCSGAITKQADRTG